MIATNMYSNFGGLRLIPPPPPPSFNHKFIMAFKISNVNEKS